MHSTINFSRPHLHKSKQTGLSDSGSSSTTHCYSSTTLQLGLLVEFEDNFLLPTHAMDYLEVSNRLSLHVERNATIGTTSISK